MFEIISPQLKVYQTPLFFSSACTILALSCGPTSRNPVAWLAGGREVGKFEVSTADRAGGAPSLSLEIRPAQFCTEATSGNPVARLAGGREVGKFEVSTADRVGGAPPLSLEIRPVQFCTETTSGNPVARPAGGDIGKSCRVAGRRSRGQEIRSFHHGAGRRSPLALFGNTSAPGVVGGDVGKSRREVPRQARREVPRQARREVPRQALEAARRLTGRPARAELSLEQGPWAPSLQALPQQLRARIGRSAGQAPGQRAGALAGVASSSPGPSRGSSPGSWRLMEASAQELWQASRVPRQARREVPRQAHGGDGSWRKAASRRCPHIMHIMHIMRIITSPGGART
jgi:hypothetical protein